MLAISPDTIHIAISLFTGLVIGASATAFFILSDAPETTGLGVDDPCTTQ